MFTHDSAPRSVQLLLRCPLCKGSVHVRRLTHQPPGHEKYWACDACLFAWIDSWDTARAATPTDRMPRRTV